MQKQHSNYLLNAPLTTSLLVAMIVVLAGIITAITPFGRWLEEDVGLDWLFKLRGELPAPQQVVVVSIDQNSARQLDLPAKPRKWPRNYHGQLVEKLKQHGATAIGFDIIFDEQRNPEHNRQFAESMQRANNVVLFQYIRLEDVKDKITGVSHGRIEKLITPIPVLAESAQGLSPFPLPKVPAKVNHFTLYKENLGSMPTLPVTVLQVHAHSVHNDLIKYITEIDQRIGKKLEQSMGNDILDLTRHQGIQNVTRQFRQVFMQHPELAETIKIKLAQNKTGQSKLIKALVNAYTCPEFLYLNFFGSFGSILTIPYHQVLSSDPNNPSIDVKGKAVFVGFSEQFQPEQKDGFYTVFTDEDSGSDISGVEIIATAFANLLEQNAITVPSGQNEILILIGWSLFISLLLRFGSAMWQLPMTILLALGYGSIVYYSFTQHTLWLPFLTPILIQLLLASLLIFLWKYRQIQQERSIIREAFGFHLPVDVVDQIAKGVNHVTGPGQKVHGIVMATDAQQYTTLSEALAPDKLHALMNDYYQTLFKPIREYQGIISDVVGDAAIAIWARPAEIDNTATKTSALNQQHQQACLAALAAQEAIDQFNLAHPQQALPTRIGLDSGQIVLGHVGALDHYEYRAVGDIVNTASRIEGVNKYLGTRIIVSESVLAGTTDLLTRKLGSFKLAGKQTAVTLCELLGHEKDSSNINQTVFDTFAEALKHFQAQDWQAALALFQSNAEDGPSRYYEEICKLYISHPPPSFDGSIELRHK